MARTEQLGDDMREGWEGESMKWKLDRKSCLAGILMGICIGISAGFMCAILQDMRIASTFNKSEVLLASALLIELPKSEENADARKIAIHSLAANYCRHKQNVGSFFLNHFYRSEDIVQSVEAIAAKHPQLKVELERQSKQFETNK